MTRSALQRRAWTCDTTARILAASSPLDAHHLPLIDAALDLLQADAGEFDRRCRLMADEDGSAIVDDVAGQLERLGRMSKMLPMLSA